jgi:tRNA(Ile)-lysidine synthase
MTPGPVAALPAGRRRDDLVAEVARQLADLPTEAAAVVACSGGPDSTALAFLTAEARPDLQLSLVHVAHGLRAAEVEDTEAQLVAQHARWLGAASRSDRVHVASQGAGGPEAAARTARYAALADAADRLGAAAILLGHTAEDQAETVLYRAARGTGLDGLASMRPHDGRLRRPLLRLRRPDVLAFVVGDGLPYATDQTNTDPAVRRSIVRHEVLPALARVAPDPVGALTRLAALAHDDADALAVAARQAIACHHLGELTVVQRPALRRAHRALARRRIRDALAPHLDQPPSADTIARVLAAEPGTRATLAGGVDLEVTRAVLTFAATQTPPPPLRVLTLPGATAWPELGAALLARTPTKAELERVAEAPQLDLGIPARWQPEPLQSEDLLTPTGGHRNRVQVLLPRIPGGLVARPAEPGDRIRTAAGTRRVAAVLGDAHVPRLLRARWPVVAAGERVVWVPGYAVDVALQLAGHRDPQLALAVVHADVTTAGPETAAAAATPPTPSPGAPE